jgi:RNA polymerase sigma-70 factor (ECF subfamily)
VRGARLEELFRRHHRHVFAYAARRVPGRADDVVAQVFAIAWRRIDDVPADAEPWLYGVARRVVAGEWRAQSRREALVSRLCEVAPAETADGEDHADLYELLARLGEADREALLLLYWEELTPARAAEALGITREAFNQRASRARLRLRTLSEETRSRR